ncbi:AbiTii domain-containing protein [Providencia rettgeri]
MEKLFNDLQSDLLEGGCTISEILRKFYKLAYELNDENLISWCQSELHGYQDGQLNYIPRYRFVKTMLRGNFIFNGAPLLNQQLHSYLLPINEQNIYASGAIYLPAPEIEFMVVRQNANEPNRELPDNLCVFFSNYQYGLVCTKAYEVIPLNNFARVIEDIKTNILSYCLELKKKFPLIDSEIIGGEMKGKSKAVFQSVFNTHVYSGGANISNGSEKFTQNLQASTQVSELVDKLISDLHILNKNESDTKIVEEIIPIINSMKESNDKQGIVKKVVEITNIAANGVMIYPALLPYFAKIMQVLAE